MSLRRDFFQGYSFYILGSLKKPNQEIAKEINNAAGNIRLVIAQDVNYVITQRANLAENELEVKAADAYEIPILSEDFIFGCIVAKKLVDHKRYIIKRDTDKRPPVGSTAVGKSTSSLTTTTRKPLGDIRDHVLSDRTSSAFTVDAFSTKPPLKQTTIPELRRANSISKMNSIGILPETNSSGFSSSSFSSSSMGSSRRVPINDARDSFSQDRPPFSTDAFSIPNNPTKKAYDFSTQFTSDGFTVPLASESRLRKANGTSVLDQYNFDTVNTGSVLVNDDAFKKQFDTMRNLSNNGMVSGTTPLNERPHCSHCDDFAVGYCTDGCKFMCEDHLKAHSKGRESSLHKVTASFAMKLYLPQKEMGMKISTGLFCPEHQGMEMILFCESCDKLICKDCVVTGHSMHKYCYCKEAASKYRPYIERQIMVMKVKQQEVAQYANQIKQVASNVDRKCIDAAIELKSCFNYIHQILVEREAILLKGLDNLRKMKSDQLAGYFVVLEQQFQALQSECIMTESYLQSEIELLRQKGRLSQKINLLCNYQLTQPARDLRIMNRFDGAQELQQFIANFGNVQVSEAE